MMKLIEKLNRYQIFVAIAALIVSLLLFKKNNQLKYSVDKAILNIKTGHPIPNRIYKMLLEENKNFYANMNNGKTFNKCSINLYDFFKYLGVSGINSSTPISNLTTNSTFTNWQSQTNLGISLYNGLNNNYGVFILLPTNMDFGCGINCPKGYELSNTNPVEIENSEMIALINSYKNNIKVKTSIENSSDFKYLSNLSTSTSGNPNIDEFKTFYSFQQLYYLISHNIENSPTNTLGNCYLCIEWGAIPVDKIYPLITNLKYRIQVPILTLSFGAPTNDPTTSGGHYKNKAMDVGKLCPPDCSN